MGVFARLRKAPPSASGRIRHDPWIAFADVAVAGLFGLSGAIRNVAPLPDVDRRITLEVADRQVVAGWLEADQAVTMLNEYRVRVQAQ